MDNRELVFLDALVTGDASGAIERSEKMEQQLTVANQRIPIKSNDHEIPWDIRKIGINDNMKWKEQFRIEANNNKKWTKEQYERMGIKIINEYDDLFLNVTLPHGWQVKATDHSMWNEVTDDKGRKRISFFYKGAFYDRDAFSNFKTRYSYKELPFDSYETSASYEERQSKEWYGVVYDGEKEVFRTVGIIKKDYWDDSPKQECIKFLKEKFPLWQDINSYWNE